MMMSDVTPSALEALLLTTPYRSKPSSIRSLKGGANNQVFAIEFNNKDPIILKRYFQSPLDPRQRLKAEFLFSQHILQSKIAVVPRPLYVDWDRQFALYTFVDGTLATRQDATETYIESAAHFLLDLNEVPNEALPLASESCTSPTDYLTTIQRKIDRLISHPDPRIQKWMALLVPEWDRRRAQCQAALQVLEGFSKETIITPSDLGLHNTLVTSDRRYVFIDFEYAGRDGLAKTIIDFFLQPKIPIPNQYFEPFFSKVSSLVAMPHRLRREVETYFPLCQVKWSCIVLNVFDPIGQERRLFANVTPREEDKLKLAEEILFSPLPWTKGNGT
jgi:thiamine kinase-like enzyme